MAPMRARPPMPPTTPPAIAPTGVELESESESGSVVLVVLGSLVGLPEPVGAGVEPPVPVDVGEEAVAKSLRTSSEDQETLARELLLCQG